MRRGTTPTIVFHLPFNVSEIKNCEVYFSQNDELVVSKSMDDCDLSDTYLAVTLTQAETLALSDEEKCEVQVRFVYQDGTVDATTILKDKVERILKDGEINVE